jgi:hypothetical protein
MMGFLRDLEESPRLLEVEHVEIGGLRQDRFEKQVLGSLSYSVRRGL